MNKKMNGGISTMRGIFCRLSFQKGGITAETIAAQGFDGGIFSVDTRQKSPEISMVSGLLLFSVYLRRAFLCLICVLRSKKYASADKKPVRINT